MLLPISHTTASLLLLVSVFCLGSWANLLLVGETRRRFELFYFDFAIGAILLALLAALTLGAIGTELSFSDRILVAGLRAQAFEIGAGFIFNVGNMLLAAAVSLIGMACSFPLALGLGLLIGFSLNLSGVSTPVLIGGNVLLLFAAVAAMAAARLRSREKTPKSRQTSGRSTLSSRMAKGLTIGVLSGVLIGISASLAQGGLWGDMGLGAYAGVLLFCSGLFLSTLIFNPFFMAIGIEGGRLTLRHYLNRKFIRHLTGASAGLLWAAGILCGLLAQSVPATEQPSQTALTLAAGAPVLIAMLWGVFVWKEFAGSPTVSRLFLFASAVLFTAGLAVASFRFLS